MSRNYGAGEIFGSDVVAMSPGEIRAAASRANKGTPCPFNQKLKQCNKTGGVCSLREYSNEGDTVTPTDNPLVTLCPARFHDSGVAFSWVGRVLLGSDSPLVLTELPFLRPIVGDGDGKEVGKIDIVLVHPDTSKLRWCALEMQAVYFSGASMSEELKRLCSWKGAGLPMPTGVRRPDFRSSGPKRLMPQLQVKVPTIARWGKKMAVIVDEAFWSSLAPMEPVNDVSNCDIAWFVVGYEQRDGRFALTPKNVCLTTLSRAVDGLTAGVPTTLTAFESTLLSKISSTKSG